MNSKPMNSINSALRINSANAKRAIVSISAFAMLVIVSVGTAQAQYFQSAPGHEQVQIIKARGLDSVVFRQMTPFAIPAVNDSITLTYHEPMPDSIMPRSAVVIGQVTLQLAEPELVVAELEKFARKNGADWIVSFNEPRAVINKQGEKFYRSTALLIHVLDPNFVNQSDLSYAYYEDTKVNNFASLNKYFDTYGRHYVEGQVTH